MNLIATYSNDEDELNDNNGLPNEPCTTLTLSKDQKYRRKKSDIQKLVEEKHQELHRKAAEALTQEKQVTPVLMCVYGFYNILSKSEPRNSRPKTVSCVVTTNLCEQKTDAIDAMRLTHESAIPSIVICVRSDYITFFAFMLSTVTTLFVHGSLGVGRPLGGD